MSEEEINTVVESPDSFEFDAWLVHILTSPTTIWFVSLYLFTLFSMIIFNIFRVGISLEGIFGGPEYYADLFFYYGLNSSPIYETPWARGILAWIFGPLIAQFLGILLFFLQDSGYAYNFGTRDQDTLLPKGDPQYAFFKEEVYGGGVTLFGQKGNFFYIGIVWIPIIAASLFTIFYKKRIDRETSSISRMIIGWVIATILALEFAKITDPDFYFSISGAIESLFVDRTRNYFVVYEGQYHPMMMMFMLAVFHLVPVFVMSLIEWTINLANTIKRQQELAKLREEYQRERTKEGVTSLPWEEDIEKEVGE